jgi:uncharacterized protein YqeY
VVGRLEQTTAQSTGRALVAGQLDLSRAGIIPAVVGGPSVPPGLGRRRRLHSLAQRLALGLRCASPDGGPGRDPGTAPALPGTMTGMSALKDRLRSDLTAAMKARDELRAGTLRMVLTAVTNAEVAGKQARELSDDDVIGVLTSEGKKRREAAEAFGAAGRAESAERERAEAAVIADYLPTQLSGEEVAALVTEAIERTGAAAEGMRAMGKVMGALQPQVRGRADGGVVAAEVRRQLG